MEGRLLRRPLGASRTTGPRFRVGFFGGGAAERMPRFRCRTRLSRSGPASAAVTRKRRSPVFSCPGRHAAVRDRPIAERARSEEHTSELQSLMRISYAVFCLKKKTNTQDIHA